MSWASSINTENCFERYAFDQSFAPSVRRPLGRSNSSTSDAPRRNMASMPSRAQSVSPTPSKKTFFGPSKREKSNLPPQTHSYISSPVLISSTNPLVTVKTRESTSLDKLEANRPQSSVSISEIIAHYLEKDSDEDDEEEEEEEEKEAEEIYMTHLSPPPSTNRKLPRVPSIPVSDASLSSQIQIQYPQARSHFSDWSISFSDDTCSTCSSPTESMFSRRESVASIFSDSSSASTIFSRRESVASILSDSSDFLPTDSKTDSFEYNPFYSQVATRGFKISDEYTLSQLTSTSSEHDKLPMPGAI